MGTDPQQVPQQIPARASTLAEVAARAQSLEDVAGLLRTLRRRHARVQRGGALTYRQLAELTGWSSAAIAEYFTARTLPPTDRFDALLGVLGALPAEVRVLADARDRAEESRRRARVRRSASSSEGSPSAADNGAGLAPRQLPADTALFTGREEEIRHLLDLAERTAAGATPGAVVISAIDGMGGVGKTALAVHAAHRLAEHFPDGQFFLDLCGFTQDTAPREPGDALAGMLAALGVPPRQVPEHLDARAALYRERLAGTRTLVVLDNAADEAQVRPLLPAASGCLVLVTSRRRLKALDDAVPVPLDVLPEEQAVALLRRAARMSGEPADEALWERAADLCGCLPLALVIAGALLRTGGKAWDLARLIDRLTPRPAGRELSGYTDEVRSVSAVFDLSYRSLPPDGQVLYRRLGLLPGHEIDAYAAAALLDADLEQADRLVQQLADHSLLAGASPGRYRIHDLIRSHASSLAAVDSGDECEAAVGRVLEYYRHTAQRSEALVSTASRPEPDGAAPRHAPDLPDAQAARAWLRTERANVEAAFDYALAHGLDGLVIALAAGLAHILIADGPWSRAVEVHRAAAEAAERRGRPADQANALIELGRARGWAGDYSGGLGDSTRGLEIFRAAGDRAGEANALNELGHQWIMTNDFPAALDAHSRALEIFRALGDRLGEAEALKDLGRVRSSSTDYAGALDAYTQALERFRALGQRVGEANLLHCLGRVRFMTGEYPEALDAQARAQEIYRAIGDRGNQSWALNHYAATVAALGEGERALALYHEALAMNRELNKPDDEAASLEGIGEHYMAGGDPDRGTAHMREALEIYLRVGLLTEAERVQGRLGSLDGLTA
jgi:tetratricopeptide (TPR) repeat protein